MNLNVQVIGYGVFVTSRQWFEQHRLGLRSWVQGWRGHNLFVKVLSVSVSSDSQRMLFRVRVQTHNQSTLLSIDSSQEVDSTVN